MFASQRTGRHLMLKIKRIYEPAAPADGKRVLIDRLWPRGLTKEKARIDEWLKEISPSDELRKWYHHEPAKWNEFKDRYRKELEPYGEVLERVKKEARGKTVTLLFSSKELERNNAVALKEFLAS
jgi:uncharacterized protein YeaO (DUF488 family)